MTSVQLFRAAVFIFVLPPSFFSLLGERMEGIKTWSQMGLNERAIRSKLWPGSLILIHTNTLYSGPKASFHLIKERMVIDLSFIGHLNNFKRMGWGVGGEDEGRIKPKAHHLQYPYWLISFHSGSFGTKRLKRAPERAWADTFAEFELSLAILIWVLIIQTISPCCSFVVNSALWVYCLDAKNLGSSSPAVRVHWLCSHRVSPAAEDETLHHKRCTSHRRSTARAQRASDSLS